MSDTLFDTAIKLREVHATMRRFYGAEAFERQIRLIGSLIEKAAKFQGVCIYTAAIRWANEDECPANLRPLILAVAVEMKLRENAALCASARS